MIFKNAGEKVRRLMNEKIETCKEILLSPQNRLILGLIVMGMGVGLGGGLIASAYIRVPE